MSTDNVSSLKPMPTEPRQTTKSPTVVDSVAWLCMLGLLFVITEEHKNVGRDLVIDL